MVQKITNRILSIEIKKISETYGKNTNRWGQTVLFIFLLIMLWFMVDSSDILRMFYLIIYLVLLLGYHAIMEFTFIKESRQYISTIILLIIVLVIKFYLLVSLFC
ncbi:DUF4181 domain-containing protein [Metasolibacillus meyeri]|uniref:DUF4181 domain-containing protein n=1 Tax=Metasolibacillus meyeri TaxID=1071052 RepID=UPI00398AD103